MPHSGILKEKCRIPHIVIRGLITKHFPKLVVDILCLHDDAPPYKPVYLFQKEFISHNVVVLTQRNLDRT